MFARCVTMHLKPKTAAQFKETVESQVVPILKRRQGFQDELVLVAPDGHEAIGISLWDTQQHAEAYAQQSYPEVQQILSNVVDATPILKAYDVSIATFRKKAARGGGGAA